MKRIWLVFRTKFEQIRDSILFPDFLAELDKYFLLHSPRMWKTKFYYIIYYVVILNIVLSVLSVFYKVEIYYIENIWIFLFILTALEFMFIVTWAGTQVTSSSVEFEYGETKKYYGLFEVFLYMFCIFLIITPSFWSMTIMKHKMAGITSEVELREDLARLDILNITKMDSPNATCTSVLATTKENLSMDHGLIEKYTGQEISNDITARENYCSAFMNLQNVNNFAYNPLGVILVLFYIIHFFLICLAWFVFVSNHVRETFMIYIGLWIIIALAIAGLNNIIVSFLGLNFSDRDKVYLVAALIWGSSAYIGWQALNTRKLKRYSFVKSFSVASFPIVVVSSTVMLMIVIGKAGILFWVALIVCLLSVPYLKGQFIKLISLPNG